MPYLNKDQNKIQPPLGELSSESISSLCLYITDEFLEFTTKVKVS
jgi:hypothetical protein